MKNNVLINISTIIFLTCSGSIKSCFKYADKAIQGVSGTYRQLSKSFQLVNVPAGTLQRQKRINYQSFQIKTQKLCCVSATGIAAVAHRRRSRAKQAKKERLMR